MVKFLYRVTLLCDTRCKAQGKRDLLVGVQVQCADLWQGCCLWCISQGTSGTIQDVLRGIEGQQAEWLHPTLWEGGHGNLHCSIYLLSAPEALLTDQPQQPGARVKISKIEGKVQNSLSFKIVLIACSTVAILQNIKVEYKTVSGFEVLLYLTFHTSQELVHMRRQSIGLENCYWALVNSCFLFRPLQCKAKLISSVDHMQFWKCIRSTMVSAFG